MPRTPYKRVLTWLPNLSIKNGHSAWAYFSKSGKTLEIYVQQTNQVGNPASVKLTLKQFLSGVKEQNQPKKEKR